MSTMSNHNPSCIELDLGLGLDNIRTTSIKKKAFKQLGVDLIIFYTFNTWEGGRGESFSFLSNGIIISKLNTPDVSPVNDVLCV